MDDAEVAKAQLESWVDNKTSVGLVFESGFSLSFNEYGALERSQSLMVFKNSIVMVIFDPRKAIADVGLKVDCYHVQLKYPHGKITIFDPRWGPEPELFPAGGQG